MNRRASIRPEASSVRWDLGVRGLLPEWRSLLSRDGLKEDVAAGITVACIAIPLSLAIALASSVEPATGLVSAVVGGLVCAIFGGTRLAVSGPAAAMAVLVGSVVEEHGLGGLLLAGVLCGALQLVTGVFGLGRLIRFVPVSVVHGFTAGVGAIILVGQLPRALGLPPPDEAHVFDVITHLAELVHQSNVAALGLTVLSVAICFGLPRVWPRVPAPLLAVVVPTAVAAIFHLQVDAIGAIPKSLPMPKMPGVPSDWPALVSSALVIYAIASLETLLSSSAVDKMSNADRHDPDQELVGQGLGNIIVAMFGGVPVTGVIARSSLNVFAGARTRRSAIVHSVVLVIAIFAFALVMARIPVSALAGVLLAVAIRMLSPAHIVQMWRSSRGEAAVFLITFATMVFVDLLVGVQWGVIAALAIAAIRLNQTRTRSHLDDTGTTRFSISGPLTFLSLSALESIRTDLAASEAKSFVIDLAGVDSIDASGGEQLRDLLRELDHREVPYALTGVTNHIRDALVTGEGGEIIAQHIAVTETEVANILGKQGYDPSRSRLMVGLERFHEEFRPNHEELFERLAEGQHPHTMLITCCDSRVAPTLLTGTSPGELFILRNLGNIIPPFGAVALPGEGAAVEYGVRVLGVRNLIVCGHARCGAIQALSRGYPRGLPSVDRWHRALSTFKPPSDSSADLEELAKQNVVDQLASLQTYPAVQQGLNDGSLRLHGWFYNFEPLGILEWNAETQTFDEIGRAAEPPSEDRSVNPIRLTPVAMM